MEPAGRFSLRASGHMRGAYSVTVTTGATVSIEENEGGTAVKHDPGTMLYDAMLVSLFFTSHLGGLGAYVDITFLHADLAAIEAKLEEIVREKILDNVTAAEESLGVSLSDYPDLVEERVTDAVRGFMARVHAAIAHDAALREHQQDPASTS